MLVETVPDVMTKNTKRVQWCVVDASLRSVGRAKCEDSTAAPQNDSQSGVDGTGVWGEVVRSR